MNKVIGIVVGIGAFVSVVFVGFLWTCCRVYVPAGEMAIVTAKTGRPLPPGRILAEPGEKGVQRVPLAEGRHFLNPINIVTDLAVPVSMGFRLFGSIMSGMLIMEMVYGFLFTSFVVPVFVSVVTTLFHALIQAYVFATLTSLFVAEATE